MPLQHRPARILRKRAVKERTGYSDTSIRDGVKRGTFPRPIRLGNGPTAPNGWIETEIDPWIAAKIAARDKTQRKT